MFSLYAPLILKQVTVGRDGWRVFRTYNQFRDFHLEMSTKYPEVMFDISFVSVLYSASASAVFIEG